MKRLMQGLIGAAVVGSVLASQAQTKFPLRVNINVSPKTSRQSIGAGADGEAKVEQVQVRVTVRKSSSQPWDDPVTAELYVIGKQIHTGHYGIIDVIKKEFNFTRDNNNTFEFSSQMYSLGRTSGNINVGGAYETFLVVIVDHEGTIVDTRSGRSIKEKGVALIRELGPQTLFDRDGNVIGKLEDPGKAFKKAIPAATHPGDDS
jgi:hypothetical protein